MCNTSNKSLFEWNDNEITLVENKAFDETYLQNDKCKDFVKLMVKNFKKFTELVRYFKDY
jgi:hypothetical protein